LREGFRSKTRSWWCVDEFGWWIGGDKVRSLVLSDLWSTVRCEREGLVLLRGSDLGDGTAVSLSDGELVMGVKVRVDVCPFACGDKVNGAGDGEDLKSSMGMVVGTRVVGVEGTCVVGVEGSYSWCRGPSFSLRDVSTESAFALSIVTILVQERRQCHQDCHNKDTKWCTLKVGIVVKSHVQVNSSVGKGVISKLSYKAKGPFIITADLGHNSYEVQRYDNPNSVKRKYKCT